MWSLNATVPYLMGLVTAMWFAAHFFGVVYGTHALPLHQSYVGDEQAPVNGALHILEDKSLLGLRNLRTVYYGPVFSVIAVPAVLGDFFYAALMEGVRSADAYKQRILWDWGGIVLGARTLSVLASALALYFVYLLFCTKTINPTQRIRYAYGAVVLLALNYYFFQYSHFFKHWTFVVPTVLGQVYATYRLYETKGKSVRYYILFALCILAGFGISYVSVLYGASSLTLLYTLWRQADALVRRRLYLTAVASALGAGLIVLWHPYALFRYLSFLGVGNTGSGGNLAGAQNPLTASAGSWGYYGNELVLNHFPLIIACGVLVWLLRRRLTYFGHTLWVFGSIAVINFLLFAPAAHHEGRYLLLTILSLSLLVAALCTAYFESDARKQLAVSALATLCVFSVLFHTVHIGRWMYLYAQGPLERVMVEEVLTTYEPGDHLLFIVPYLVGYPHTTASYEEYMDRFNRRTVNLFNELVRATPPPGSTPLSVRYENPATYVLEPSVLLDYDQVIRWVPVRTGEINQFDYMDESIVRLWYYRELMPSYVRLK